MKAEKISLYSRIFADMRDDLDEKITQAFSAMEDSKIADATISLKISLALQEHDAVDADGKLRIARVPVMAYKVQNSVKAVYAEAGVMDTAEMELVPDGSGGYVLKPIGNEQIDMMDMMEECEDEENNESTDLF